MKKLIIEAGTFVLLAAMTGIAHAIPVNFDLAGSAGGSSVTATGTPTCFLCGTGGDISATLASDLDDQVFTLNDGETMMVDFFTLTATGLSLGEDYTVEATLGFDLPGIGISSGSGEGEFSTFFGALSGGTLTWDSSTLVDTFVDELGNTISIYFESGSTIGFGDTATVHAFITNEGIISASVPEPSVIALLALGLLGVGGVSRMRKTV